MKAQLGCAGSAIQTSAPPPSRFDGVGAAAVRAGDRLDDRQAEPGAVAAAGGISRG